jgi:catechol 2,3-dioxygenase-like lactoylglutathione lyase family enzyme
MKQLVMLAGLVGLLQAAQVDGPETNETTEELGTMDLGAFSVSLAVADLGASRSFYEKLGFEVAGGEATQNWLILRNGTTTIGLFQGMFEQNILTFNPGWDAHAQELDEFTDVREIQRRLVELGLELEIEADESTEGPASLVVVDPDGNPVLIDQHR